MGLKDLLWCTNSHHPCGPSAIHTTNKHRAANLVHTLQRGKMAYCKALNISVPLMLTKLAMQYHSLTFWLTKITVYCYACAVVCHVVSKVGNGILPVQLVAGKQLSLLLPSCDNPCTRTSAENRSVEQVRVKEWQKRGKYNHYDAEVRAKIVKHACKYGNKSAL